VKEAFGSLETIKVAQLTEGEIEQYVKEGINRDFILKEIADCKKRLDSMGIIY